MNSKLMQLICKLSVFNKENAKEIYSYYDCMISYDLSEALNHLNRILQYYENR